MQVMFQMGWFNDLRKDCVFSLLRIHLIKSLPSAMAKTPQKVATGVEWSSLC